MSTGRIRTSFEDFDFDAREAQVAGNEQRIPPMPISEFTEEAKELADTIRTVFGVTDLSTIPDIFATMFKHPGVYRSQLQLGVELNKQGALRPRERELVILRVAWLSRSPFEWGEHVDLGKQHGLSEADILRLQHGSDAAGWSPNDRAIVRAVEELLDDYTVSDETWRDLAEFLDEKQLIELPALTGAYAMTAMIYNSVRFALLPGNRGFRHS